MWWLRSTYNNGGLHSTSQLMVVVAANTPCWGGGGGCRKRKKKKNSLVWPLRLKNPVPHWVPKPIRPIQRFRVSVCPIQLGMQFAFRNVA